MYGRGRSSASAGSFPPVGEGRKQRMHWVLFYTQDGATKITKPETSPRRLSNNNNFSYTT